jgi:hypothetical protein
VTWRRIVIEYEHEDEASQQQLFIVLCSQLVKMSPHWDIEAVIIEGPEDDEEDPDDEDEDPDEDPDDGVPLFRPPGRPKGGGPDSGRPAR